MSRKSDIFIAFAVGASLGATIGILFAPDNGKDTRDKLSFNLEKYKFKLKDLISKYTKGEIDDSGFSSAKNDGIKVVNEARSQAEALLSDVEDMIHQINKGNIL